MQPFKRHRRLRSNAAVRKLIRETVLQVEDFILPLFVVDGTNVRKEVPSMPGVFQLSLDQLAAELHEIEALGIPSVMLFGIPGRKDARGSEAYSTAGIVQQATRLAKKEVPELYIMADTCLCGYTDHGHCGVIEGGEVHNDASLQLLAKIAVSQAQAGADMIAPSNMMDGFVATIRAGLDEAGFAHIPILSYAVKYASAFYGPFREAAASVPTFGDRKTYQMDPANAREAHREAQADVEEGADLLMVKPALNYLDVIRHLRDSFDLPLVAYNVSGEYAMVKAAALNGWIDEQAMVLEILTGLKRAGADMILSYHAKDAARWLTAT